MFTGMPRSFMFDLYRLCGRCVLVCPDPLCLIFIGYVDDVYWYAQTLYLTGQYHRASRLLQSRKLDKVIKLPQIESEWNDIYSYYTYMYDVYGYSKL